MHEQDRPKVLEETKVSLQRLQSFDVNALPRVNDLGSELSFADAATPANLLLDLYRQLPVEVLDSLPTTALKVIKNQADSDFNILQQMLKFSPKSGNPVAERDSLLNQLRTAYRTTFDQLNKFISYAVRKSTDFARLEREARAAVQSAMDKASALQTELEAHRANAEKVLATIRKVAEEQGVSQQAVYFKNEADAHEKRASVWLTRTVWLTVLLACYAIGTIFLHKWSFIAPTSSYETVQLAVSKLLIFATVSFFLILAARNFAAHRHNAVVNRHRQNALLTYESLTRAAGADANRDIVLTEAAKCIFAPQGTAFSKGESADGGSYSVVSLGSVKPTVTGS